MQKGKAFEPAPVTNHDKHRQKEKKNEKYFRKIVCVPGP